MKITVSFQINKNQVQKIKAISNQIHPEKDVDVKAHFREIMLMQAETDIDAKLAQYEYVKGLTDLSEYTKLCREIRFKHIKTERESV